MVMSINKNLLKEELLKSPFLDLAKAALKPNDEIIAVQIAGSYAAKLNTDKSDIDISVLTLKS
jgi:predicted nucleotidyltransferase